MCYDFRTPHWRESEFYPSMKVELIEKAAQIVGDNQLLVNIVSKRVQQLNHGSDPYIPTTPEMGCGDIALTEIIEGKITWREQTEEDLEQENDPFAAEPVAEEAPAPTVAGTVSGVGAVVKHGKLVLSIKEGKDIYIELPI